ncbi:hypothetical protein [Ralstonia chuxiongensis]|uniref:hypothetical protein n=1 Tax=Ralstonia chuxiongensis TaxID=2957504 RepID=UPI00292ED862|nr:hypothetical protein [Ralstonia chuxiongensis]
MEAHAHSIKGPDVEQFLGALIRQGDSWPTDTVLDNVAIHHSIGEETRDRWLMEHKAPLLLLPPYGPELNRIKSRSSGSTLNTTGAASSPGPVTPSTLSWQTSYPATAANFTSISREQKKASHFKMASAQTGVSRTEGDTQQLKHTRSNYLFI